MSVNLKTNDVAIIGAGLEVRSRLVLNDARLRLTNATGHRSRASFASSIYPMSNFRGQERKFGRLVKRCDAHT